MIEHATRTADMVPHLATLTRLASGASTVVELGVRTGVSTWAILDGLPGDGSLVSVDVDLCDVPGRVSADYRWTFLRGDSLEVEPIVRSPLDLLFIDASHEYHQTLAELEMGERLRTRLIVLHDWNLPDVHDAVLGFTSRTGYQIVMLERSDWGLVGLAR
jgi:predicted O-methyltransferase YrrM